MQGHFRATLFTGLTEEQKQACEGKILLEECEFILERFS